MHITMQIKSLILHALQFNWTQNMNYYGRFANFSVEPSDLVCSIQVESYLRELSGVIRNTSTRYVLVYKVS